MSIESEFRQRLRATSEGAHRISLYLANKDRFNQEFDLAPWIERAVGLLSTINNGCTRLPIARGTWLENGQEIHDDTVIVYSNIDDIRNFFNRLNEVILFVHDYGRDTDQGAVMLEFCGKDGDSYFNNTYFIKRQDYIISD